DPSHDPQTVWLNQEPGPPRMSLASIQQRARKLQARGRRDFVVTSLFRVLLIAYFAVTAATSERVTTQLVDVVAIVFVLATFYRAYTSVDPGALWREPSPRDAGATASLEFYRRELV